VKLKTLPSLLSIAALVLAPLTSEACNVFYVPADFNPGTSAASAPIPFAAPKAGGQPSPSGLQHPPNRGFYSYNASTGKYHLTYAMYDSAVTSESLLGGDIWATDSGSSAASPSISATEPGVTPAEECGGYVYDITTLESITVTAFAPPTGGADNTYFERIIEPTGWGGGGGGAIDRKIKPPQVGAEQGDSTLTCDSDSLSLELSAVNTLRANSPGIYHSGASYMIEYAPGSFQVWIVTSPLLSNLGLVAAGPCVTVQ